MLRAWCAQTLLFLCFLREPRFLFSWPEHAVFMLPAAWFSNLILCTETQEYSDYSDYFGSTLVLLWLSFISEWSESIFGAVRPWIRSFEAISLILSFGVADAKAWPGSKLRPKDLSIFSTRSKLEMLHVRATVEPPCHFLYRFLVENVQTLRSCKALTTMGLYRHRKKVRMERFAWRKPAMQYLGLVGLDCCK